MGFNFLLIVGLIAGGITVGIAGWGIYSVLQEYRKDRVPALLYHHFAAGRRPSQGAPEYDPVYFCYEASFAEQLDYLQREGYSTISIGDFVAFQKGAKKLPPKSVILTFDDGFASNYHYAYPLLKKHGMTATIFMTVNRDAENFKKYSAVDTPLTDAQLREMSENGVAIESHSMTHRYLSLQEPETIRWELAESRKSLSETLQKPVRFLAIPSGAYSPTVKRLVRETGYEAAFCMLKGSNNRGSDPFALRRLVIGRDFTLDDFRRILEPGTGCYLRLTSSIQNTLLFLLGPGGLDALRNFLYRSRLGTSLIRGQLKYVAPVIGGVVLLVLVGLALAARRFF
jgi:peptidoglycan/xylan/chitin deacetylase (PgdA/CDA1 family)